MDRVFQDVSGLLASFLCPEILGRASCVGKSTDVIAANADWQHWCTHCFGDGCLQYVQFLGYKQHTDRMWKWRELFWGLKTWHYQLGKGSFNIDWQTASIMELGSGDHVALPESLENCHSVIAHCTSEEVRLMPLSSGKQFEEVSFAPASFVEVDMVSVREVVCLTHDLALERWDLRPNHHELILRRPVLWSIAEEQRDGVRVFVEHQAARVFVFTGACVFAHDLETLRAVYEVRHMDSWSNPNLVPGNLYARWDFGRNFLLCREDGRIVSLWSTVEGHSRGSINAEFPLLGFDLTHTNESQGSSAIDFVVTLEVDNLIRVYKESDSLDWCVSYICPCSSLSALQLFCGQLQIEGNLLVAGSHAENGSCGAIHIWRIPVEAVCSEFSDDCLQGVPLCPVPLCPTACREFSRLPHRVEMRHGGAIIEVCFEPEQGEWPEGVYDVIWLNPLCKTLPILLECSNVLWDVRCDIRDTLAIVQPGVQSIHWIHTWPQFTWARMQERSVGRNYLPEHVPDEIECEKCECGL